jgi:hypothetical protein
LQLFHEIIHSLCRSITIGDEGNAAFLQPLLDIPAGDATHPCGASDATRISQVQSNDLVKGRFTGARPERSAVQMALIGGLAATAAFAIARAMS